MSKYIIEGGKKLSGQIILSGNKNSILPCLAATLLTDQEVILKNVPNIADVAVSLEILRFLGAEIVETDHTIKIKCPKIKDTNLPDELTSKLRASLLFVGPLIAKTGKAHFHHPGGDIIGRRGFELHLEAFSKLGYAVKISDREYKISKSKTNSLPITIFFEGIATVTGTENLIMASVLRKGTTVIRNAAQEPHVISLCQMLNQMGAKISGLNSPTLTIEGVEKLSGTEFTIDSDGIELGTYAVAAAITGGNVEFHNAQSIDLTPITWPLAKMGIQFSSHEDTIKASSKKLISIPRLITNVWPGFPTDMMSAVIVLATQSRGVSLLHDWVYESRMFFVDKLISMGANITLADPHRVVVYGPSKLYGRNLETPDIRAGMALVLAALAADGKSVINRAELIERGYEDVVEKLISLGANIQKVD